MVLTVIGTKKKYPCRHYDAKRIYGTTKLANLLMAKELARRLKPHNVVSNAVHPGSVQTDLFRNIPFLGHVVYHIMGMLFKSAKVKINLLQVGRCGHSLVVSLLHHLLM